MIQNQSTINSFRYIFLTYISVIVVFSFLYMLPYSHKGNVAFIDLLFVSTSALSVTGLTTLDTATQFTRVGQSLLMIEMQLGGIGILVLVSYLFLMMGKRITMSSMLLISKDQNQSNLKTIKSLSIFVLIIAVIVEGICSLLTYRDISQHYTNKYEALFVTVFHSVASFTNAGFTLFNVQEFVTTKVVLIATAATIFIGSIGFPTIMELIFSFKKKRSLFTKINLEMHCILLIFGTVVFYLLEHNNVFKALSLSNQVTNSVFLSAIIRSGGISSINISSLTITTILIMLCLMFIGGASSSTGGGIRLTTFRVLLSKMVSVAKSQKFAVIGRKTITQEAVNKSFLIFLSFVMLAVISTILLSLFEIQPIEKIVFEVISALTNTGLSMGITSSLTVASKCVLMLLMIIGRIGVFTLIYFVFKIDHSKVRYLNEDLAVG